MGPRETGADGWIALMICVRISRQTLSGFEFRVGDTVVEEESLMKFPFRSYAV